MKVCGAHYKECKAYILYSDTIPYKIGIYKVNEKQQPLLAKNTRTHAK